MGIPELGQCWRENDESEVKANGSVTRDEVGGVAAGDRLPAVQAGRVRHSEPEVPSEPERPPSPWPLAEPLAEPFRVF